MYYEILNVNKNASKEEIKKSYRKLSIKHHPDKGGTVEQFQQLANAFTILYNDESRKKYDVSQQGNNSNNTNNTNTANNSNNSSNSNNSNNNTNDEHINDMLKQMYGYAFTYILKPSILTKTIQININTIFEEQLLPIEIERTIITNNDTSTATIETELLYVSIPKGVDNNEIIMINGKGNITNSYLGDVKLVVKLINTTEFERKGLDLIYYKDITLKEALCGVHYVINHICGKTYNIKDTDIIFDGKTKIIPNLGICREYKTTTNQSIQGNLIIIYHVRFPKVLDEHVIEQLKNIDF